MGYSLGGGVALQVAIRHPGVVRKLVVVSAPATRSGWYPEILAAEAQMNAAVAEQMKQSPMYALYASLAPRPQDWPVVVTKLGELLKIDYDWSKGIANITAPTLLVFADQDAVQMPAMAALFGLFGGGRHAPTFDGSGRRGRSWPSSPASRITTYACHLRSRRLHRRFSTPPDRVRSFVQTRGCVRHARMLRHSAMASQVECGWRDRQ
jgi:hypothetical protein